LTKINYLSRILVNKTATDQTTSFKRRNHEKRHDGSGFTSINGLHATGTDVDSSISSGCRITPGLPNQNPLKQQFVERRDTMKTTVAFILIAGLSLSSAALAEPFNDRGEDFRASVRSSASTAQQTVAATPNGFNNRGVDYIATAPTGSSEPLPEVMLTEHGFNQRSWVADES
jgi:hypothetical protein